MTISKSWFSYLTRAFALFLCTALLLNFASCSDSSSSQEPKAVNSIYTATKDSFSSIIASLTEDSTIVVTGELSDSDLTAIANAINNSTYNVNLDLSQTTGLISIPEIVFDTCTKLSGIIIPDSVTSIGDGAFYDCKSLSSVTIPNSVTFIGIYAFCGCKSLSSVTIPDSVTSIGDGTFSGCDSLSSVTIPDSVTSIGYYAFYGCSKLTAITFIDTTTWYRTDDSTDWKKKTTGSLTDVSDAAANAGYFKDTYKDYYWYKL